MHALMTRPATTSRRSFVALLVVLLVTGLFGARAAAPLPVRAVDCPPGQVPQIIGGQIFCVPDGGLLNDFDPDRLLNRSELRKPLHLATDDQAAALLALEEEAITNASTAHQIPSSERSAVQTWGRSEAQAELWALLVKAIKTPACSPGQTTGCRTPTQQQAAQWMADMNRRQGNEVAKAAGLELVKYAGLSETGYAALFANDATPSRETLEAFLDDQPVNFNNTNTSLATGGYCVYRAPSPYGDEYTGYNDQTCFRPCSNVLGCDDPIPTADSLIKWGTARNLAQANTSELAQASREIAQGIGAGAIAAGIVVGVGIGATLGVALAGTAFATTVFPFAAIAVTGTVVTSWTGATTAITGTTMASSIAGGGVAAAGVGAIFAAVVLFIVGTTLRLIALLEDAAVPGKVAQAIVDARNANYDPAPLIGTADEATLWRLFVGATLPAVRYETCNNHSLINAPPGPAAALCLNPPAIPAAAAGDLQFVVTTHPSATEPASSTEVSPSITFRSNTSLGLIDTTTRLHGNWFIHSYGQYALQSMRIRYADWNHDHHTAWLYRDADGVIQFLGMPEQTCAEGTACSAPPLNVSTCLTAGTCELSATIKYVGGDGSLHTARVLGPAAVSWPSPSAITYGAPLGTTQLAASVPGVPGAFRYTADGQPVSAADLRILHAGSHTLGVTFTPTDATTVLPGTKSVQLTVDPAPLTVRASSEVMTYGNTVPFIAPEYEGFVGDDGPDQLAVLPDCFAQATSSSGVGTYDTECTGGSGADYDLGYAKGTIKVVARPLRIRGSSPTITYGDSPPAIQPVYLGLAPGKSAADLTTPATCTTTTLSRPPAATYPTSCSGATGSNYAISYEDGTLTVAQKALSITGPDRQKTYGATVSVPSTDFATDGLLSGDSVTGVTYTSGGFAATAPVSGSPYAITPGAATGTGLTNYKIEYVPGSLDVGRKGLTITAKDRTKTYGDSVTFAGTEFGTEGLVNGDKVTSVTLTSTGAGANAGVTGSPYAVVASQAAGTGLGNYDLHYTDGKLKVDPAGLTVTASSPTVILGATVPAITPAYSGFVAGDDPDDLTTKPQCSTTATSASAPGSYTSTCSGATSTNYAITHKTGAVKVTYDISPAFSQVIPTNSGATLPVKVQLRDAQGRNISSASVTVTLVSPALSPSPAPGSQPSGRFTYVAKGSFYQFDLKTTKYPKGTYVLTFLVAGDPVPHAVQIAIR